MPVSKVGSLQTIAEDVNRSAECNHTELVSREDWSTIVHTYDWTHLFAPRMKKIIGVKKLHHFRIDSASPGCVFTKEQCRSETQVVESTVDSWCWRSTSCGSSTWVECWETMVSVRPDMALPLSWRHGLRLSTSICPETKWKQTGTPQVEEDSIDPPQP